MIKLCCECNAVLANTIQSTSPIAFHLRLLSLRTIQRDECVLVEWNERMMADHDPERQHSSNCVSMAKCVIMHDPEGQCAPHPTCYSVSTLAVESDELDDSCICHSIAVRIRIVVPSMIQTARVHCTQIARCAVLLEWRPDSMEDACGILALTVTSGADDKLDAPHVLELPRKSHYQWLAPH